MKSFLFTIPFLVLIFSCARKTPTPSSRNTPALLKITALKTDNLSEDLTGNDEIHLMIWLIKDSIPNRSVLKETQDSLSFTETYQSKPLANSYSLQNLPFSKGTLVIVLMEVDTDKPFPERADLVRKTLQQSNYQTYDTLFSKLSQTILDDDLLAISFYKLSDLQKNPSGELVFSGMHLFDKYFYRLKYQLE